MDRPTLLVYACQIEFVLKHDLLEIKLSVLICFVCKYVWSYQINASSWVRVLLQAFSSNVCVVFLSQPLVRNTLCCVPLALLCVQHCTFANLLVVPLGAPLLLHTHVAAP